MTTGDAVLTSWTHDRFAITQETISFLEMAVVSFDKIAGQHVTVRDIAEACLSPEAHDAIESAIHFQRTGGSLER
jgi:hypothetical protein